eukprot:TRINITY_DN689_c0_g1_i2.p1 TRINITY_DN689_c0_g1~~TRINITY_DN689_c0_g1_i2.p1  ORF type:complete len:106 (-),score=21.83 TRINITY_DN689_c0_g1_i2:53-370(-)
MNNNSKNFLASLFGLQKSNKFLLVLAGVSVGLIGLRYHFEEKIEIRKRTKLIEEEKIREEKNRVRLQEIKNSNPVVQKFFEELSEDQRRVDAGMMPVERRPTDPL